MFLKLSIEVEKNKLVEKTFWAILGVFFTNLKKNIEKLLTTSPITYNLTNFKKNLSHNLCLLALVAPNPTTTKLAIISVSQPHLEFLTDT